ncbi:MAG: urease accessory protein UreD [Pseudomonadota bacterium]
MLGPKGLERLYQRGAAKAMLPRIGHSAPEVVFLNTAGGLTGGDRFSSALKLRSGAATGTTQTAERAYRSPVGRADVTVRLDVGPGASLAWLPQETILYDGAAMTRDTEAVLGDGARLVLCDMIVLGRIAMGEDVRRLDLIDRRQVTRRGRPVLIEALRLGAGDLARRGAAGLRGARAIAALHLIADDAPDRLAPLRNLLPEDMAVAASAWDGRLSLRAMDADPARLRDLLTRLIPCLTGRPLPRVWPT